MRYPGRIFSGFLQDGRSASLWAGTAVECRLEVTMNPVKLTSVLATRVEEADDDEVLDIVLELKPAAGTVADTSAGTRAEKIAARQEAFSHSSLPVETAIRQAGGEVVASAWINQTVRARVPAKGVGQLSDLEPVAVVDLPRALEPDFG